jgi:hypothetical protein
MRRQFPWQHNAALPGSTLSPSTWMVIARQVTDISTPGISVRSRAEAACLALAIPSRVSWSVNASTFTPASCAFSIKLAGSRVPSEAVE